MPAKEIKEELQAEIPQEQPIEQPPMVSPLEIAVDEKLQDTLVQIALQDFNKMEEDRNNKDYGKTSKGKVIDFDERMKLMKDLYYANREPKTLPWKYCSNRSLRIGTAILDMLHARLLPAVFNEDTMNWRPGGLEDVPKVDRINRFMKIWLKVRAKIRTFVDEWVKYTAGMGECFVETGYEEEIRDAGNLQQMPIADESGMPLINGDGTEAIQTTGSIRKTERSRSRIIPRENVYMFDGTEDIQNEPVIIKDTYLFHELEDMEVEGKLCNVSNLLKPLIKVQTPENAETEEERERIEDIRRRNVPVEVLRWYSKYDADGDGIAENVRIMVAHEYNIYLGGVRIRDISYRNLRPIHFQVYSPRIDSPGKLAGEGVLEQVRELAEEIDAIFNQLTDANTLSILKPWFFDPSGDMDADAIQIAPNKGIPISNPTQNVYFPEFRIETQNLILAIRMVMEFIERLTAASSYVMGKESEIVGGSGTATRTQAIVQSAEMRFSIPTQRLREGLAQIFTQHLDLLQKNLPEGLETRFMGEKGESLFGPNELSKEGIAGEFDAFLTGDPGMGSKYAQREIAGILYSMLLQNIIVGTDPMKIYTVTADLLKAYDQDPERILGPAPNPDDIDSPEDENTLMIQGDFARVRAQITENHLYHIQIHMELINSPSLAELNKTAPHLTAQIADYNKKHIEEHQQMMMLMQQIIMSVAGSTGGKGGQGTTGGIAPTSQEVGGKPSVQGAGGPLGQVLEEKRAGESTTT